MERERRGEKVRQPPPPRRGALDAGTGRHGARGWRSRAFGREARGAGAERGGMKLVLEMGQGVARREGASQQGRLIDVRGGAGTSLLPRDTYLLDRATLSLAITFYSLTSIHYSLTTR